MHANAAIAPAIASPLTQVFSELGLSQT